MKEKRFDTHTLVLMGLLITVEIVLSRFCSISAWNFKIGFSFVPVALAAILMGPVSAGIVAALADFIGALLFPIGAYFPGFTVTAFLTGITFGLFLQKKQTTAGIVGAVAVNQLVWSLLLNTLWISVLYGSPYGPLFVTRIAQCAVLAPIQFVVVGMMTKLLSRYGKRVPA